MTPQLFLISLVAAGPQLLWPRGVPGVPGREEADQPALTAFLPAASRAVGAAVVVCPGGSYLRLAGHEGEAVARWFAERGVAAFVLKYRLGPRHRHPAQLDDVKRALRTVRAQAASLGVATGKIGVVGFSAGGHLASMAATLSDDGTPKAADPIDRHPSRPDFAVLAYPVITMSGPAAHDGSRRALLGDAPSAAQLDQVSTHRLVTPRTPPTFLFHTGDDGRVSVDNSLLFYQALLRAGVPAELHAYEHGRHGVGLAADDPTLASWPGRLEDWLRRRGILPIGPAAAPAPDSLATRSCPAGNWVPGPPVAALSAEGQQDVLLAASRSGDVVLHQRGACGESLPRLLLSDRRGGAYATVDITEQTGLRDMRQFQSRSPLSFLTLSPDGLSIVGVSGDGRRLLQSSRPRIGSGDFSPASPGPFSAIARTTGGLAFPLLSADGRAFYYKVVDDPAANGHHESVRPAPGDPFPPGTLLPPAAQQLAAVKGVSPDRLILLLLDISTAPWSTVLLTRQKVTEPFVNPRAPHPPPSMRGFRNLVLADCRQVLGNYTTDRCPGEDIHLFTAP